jgi:hypothetical protein
MARRDLEDDLGEILKVSGYKGAKTSWAMRHWHAMGARPYPRTRDEFDGDIAEVMRAAVLPGSLPSEPLLVPEDEVITVGSCFARELRDHLLQSGVGSRSIWIPDGLNNSFAILDFVSWGITGSATGRGYRYGRDGAEIKEWKPPAISREECVAAFRTAGAFVFTLGLAEVWEDGETGAVFWQGVPESIFDPNRHVFRLSTVTENEENILEVVRLIRTVNADAPIVFTLSPIPLRATFRDVSCVVADCVSKSVLRVAIDLVMSRRLSGVYYWPSYEVVRWLGAHRTTASYAKRAHRVRPVIVSAIIDAFVEAFYVTPPVVSPEPGSSAPSLAQSSE